MKSTQKGFRNQAQDNLPYSPNYLEQGDQLASPSAPHGEAGDAEASLLYHSENNSDKRGKKKPYKPTNLQAKTFHVLDANCKHWMK